MLNHRYTPDMSGNVVSKPTPKKVESSAVDVIIDQLLKQEDLWTFLIQKEEITIDRSELRTIGYLRGIDQPTTQLLVSLNFPERFTLFVESATQIEKIYQMRGNQLTVVTVKPHFGHQINTRVARTSHGLNISTDEVEHVSMEVVTRLSNLLKRLYD